MQPGPLPSLYSTDAPLRPSGWWYGLAAVIGLGGVVTAIVLFVVSFSAFVDKIDDFERVEIPGEDVVSLEAGDYTIYHEYTGELGRDPTDPFVGIETYPPIELTAPDGRDVELREYSSEVTYETSDEEGIALFSFTAEETGDYTVSVDGPAGSSSRIAIGPGIGEGLLTGIGVAVLVGLASVAIAGAIAITTGVRRGKERRRRLVIATPNYWPGAGPPQPVPRPSSPPQAPPMPWQPPQDQQPPSFG